MISFGIDPGKSGAIAVLSTYSTPALLEVRPMPLTDGGKLVDCSSIARWLFECDVEAGVVEEVHSMPKQGVASTFAFGRGYGQLIGMLQTAGLPFVLVPPQTWKRHLGILKEGKAGSKAAAHELFPQAKDKLTSHDKCEAALLAWWGWKSRVASGEEPREAKKINSKLILPDRYN